MRLLFNPVEAIVALARLGAPKVHGIGFGIADGTWDGINPPTLWPSALGYPLAAAVQR